MPPEDDDNNSDQNPAGPALKTGGTAESIAPASNAGVLSFPHSKVLPSPRGKKFTYLGIGKMAEVLGAAKEQQSGHWCSRCKGIWFGYLLEVECPKCGNRQG